MTKTLSTPKRRTRTRAFLKRVKLSVNTRWKETAILLVYCTLDYLQDGTLDGSLLSTLI